jgi:hypothetical protein
MHTSVQLTAPHGSTANAVDRLSGWSSALAAKTGDSSAPPGESEFHRILRQGDPLSEDDDQSDARDNAPASRDRDNGSPDSAYLFSEPIALTPARPVVPVEASTPDSQTPEDSTKIPLSSAAPTESIEPERSKPAASVRAGRVDRVEREDGGKSVVGNSRRTPLAYARGSESTPHEIATIRERSESAFSASGTDVQTSGNHPSTPSSSSTQASAPQSENDQEIAQPHETKPERMADSATLTALLNLSDATPSRRAPDSPVAFEVPALPLEPADAGHTSQRKTSPQTASPQSASIASTPEPVSLSPAPDAVESGSSTVESPAPQKTANVNAPVEWNVETDDSRVSTADSNSSDPVVFEAKLTPEPVAPAPATSATATTISAPQAAPKSVAVEADEANSAPQVKTEALFKIEVPAQISSAPIQSEMRPTAAAQPEAPIAMQMQPLIESPAPAASSHAVTVNIRESSGDPGVNLRFVERGGEIHVSVRTSDLGLAQDLRGGLSDLTGRLEHAGIRTEISTLSAGEPNSQKDTQQPPSDQRGSGRQSQDSQREQPDPRKNKPSAWREAIEDSTGANSNQEQTI